MKFKKIVFLLLAVVLTLAISATALAADESQSYEFRLRANGGEALTVEPGEAFTVNVTLSRTDKKVSSYTLYAATYVLWYDPTFLEPDFSGIVLNEADERGVTYYYSEKTDMDGWSSITVSVYTGGKAVEWDDGTELISFKAKGLRVGASTLLSARTAMSNEAGVSYATTSNDVVVTVKTENAGGGTSSGTSGGGAGDGAAASPVSKQLYDDVPESSWCYDAVKYVTEAGLFNGMGDNKFGPEGTMNRAMFVTVLHRYAKLPVAKATPDFTDVQTGQWYSEAIAWASENGIVNGYGDGIFGLTDDITLEQMITVIYRYCGVTASGSVPTAYGDISPWAQDAMRWASTVGLFNGVGGTLTAGKPASRAQVAAFMANLNKLELV